MSRFNPKFDANIVKQILASTGGDKQKLIEMFNDPDQAYLQPAILMADMESQALKRDAEIKRGQGQGQHPTVAAALGLAPPPVLPAGLGAIGPQGGGMPAPQGMQMASAAPQGPVRMAAGGMTELPDSYGLESLPIPDSMYNEESFAGGGIVAFAKGSPGEVEADSFWSKVGQLPSERRKKGAPPPTDRERNSYRDYARGRAAAMGLDPNFVDQLFLRESKYDPYAMSGTGPRGIAQFTGATGKAYGLETKEDRFDPKKSIDAALAHISDLAKKYNSDATKIAVAYNQGETALNRNLKENRGVLNLDAFKDPQVKPYVAAVAGGKGTGGKQIASVMAPQTQMARAEPPRSPLDVFTRPLGTTSAQAAPPIPRMAQPQTPQVQMPQFKVASAEPPSSPVLSGLGAAASALNPIGTARAGELPKPKDAGAGAGNRENYIPTEEALFPRAGRAIGRAFNTAAGDIDAAIQNMAAAELNQAAMGANIVPALVGGQLTPYRSPTTPPSMVREPKPFTGKPSLLPDGRPYAGPYNFKEKAGANAVVTPTAATPAVPGSPGSPGSPGGSGDSSYADAIKKRYDLLSNLIGKSPELTKISDTELAAQRDQDYGMALLAAAAKGLSSKDPTFLGSLGAAAEGAIPALTESAKDRKVREREQRLAQQQRDMLDYKTRADLASAADTSVRSGEMLAAQTPEAIQYAQRAAATHQAQNPNLRPGELNTVFNKALVEYRQRTAKPTGQYTPAQAQKAAQDAALYGNLPLGPDGKRMTVEQYTDALLQKYGYGSGVGEWAVVG